MNNNKPVMFLDIDDTLLIWGEIGGFAAPGAVEFMRWAVQHWEVRWLTMWCPSGRLEPHGAAELSYRFGHQLPPEFFQAIVNPHGWFREKRRSISDAELTRHWVWVEDGLHFSLGPYRHRFYQCNVTEDPLALQKTWLRLAERFDLPRPPEPWAERPIFPPIILSNNDVIRQYRHTPAWEQ